MSDIGEELYEMIEEEKGIPVPRGKAVNLHAHLGFDSLLFVKFLLKIEERYSIAFDISEMEACLQVDRLVALVENKVKEQCRRD